MVNLPKVKRGFAKRRNELLDEIRILNHELTHYIIAYVAGDESVEDKKTELRNKLRVLADELDSIIM